jgi:hypothetical protein
MSEILRDFLIDVAVDPDRAIRFAADPAAELDRLNLTSEERAALLARDSARLREALGAARKGVANVISQKKKGTRKGARKKPAVKKSRKAPPARRR